jgi:GT2 family glycosyltransferase
MISVIVPTIGRPDSLRLLLTSLANQTVKPSEVIVADGGESPASRTVCEDPRWAALSVRHLYVSPPNAVRQREAAIAKASGSYLLFLDDDVELEPNCIERLLETVESEPGVVAAMADFSNESWGAPTIAWRWYLRLFHGLREGEWQGKVIGPLLRFGFDPTPAGNKPCEWFGTCNSLVRKDAYFRAGGFSDFFLHRCTMNEDVDLGLKLARLGKIIFCPAARLAHYHAPSGRVSLAEAAEDDVYNRYMVLKKTAGRSTVKSFLLVASYVFIESGSNLLGSLRRLRAGKSFTLLGGRVRGLVRAITG